VKAEAIVYESNTGFTKKYAELLSQTTGLAAYARSEVGTQLKKGAEVIFMGWLMAGGVKGYKQALRKYHVKALAAVGMGSPTDKVVSDIVKKYSISQTPVFYLQGGFDINKLHGLYRFMMLNMAKMMDNTAKKKETKTDEELLMLDLIKNSRDFVSADKLEPIITWLR
jgi:hypothetical protein